MDIKERLFKLSEADAAGCVKEASDLACKMLSEYCETEKTDNLTIIGFLKGKADYTLMLDAHIDQISMVVTDIDQNGFLTVSAAGGIDVRSLPSRRVTIHGKEKGTGVFCSIPPHLAKDKKEIDDISEIKIDSCLKDKAKDVISVGDIVTFNSSPFELLGTKVAGRSFDDRAAVVCLIEVAKRLCKGELPFNVAFVLSDGEELGMRGAGTAAFKVNPDEAIAVDVSFGDGLGISSEESGSLGKGGMIGVSPVLTPAVSRKLMSLAEEKGIPYQIEVMGSSTGTDADKISINREGVKTATLSIPLRNMHSEVEILDIKDLEYVTDLLCLYILSGGVMNA